MASGRTWFVIGATARDLFLHFGHGVPIARATSDVDLGVQMKSWDEYRGLKQLLLDSGRFTPSGIEHRLYHATRLPLDLVPFGQIASAADIITWPDKERSEMSVVGYEDALKSAKIVRLAREPVLDVPVAKPPGVVILKILSWSENPLARARDADDLAYILINYLDAGNWERLASNDADLTQMENFNTVLAGAQMLGRDIALLASDKTMKVLSEVLDREVSLAANSKLALAMSRACNFSNHDPVALLHNLRLGLEDK